MYKRQGKLSSFLFGTVDESQLDDILKDIRLLSIQSFQTQLNMRNISGHLGLMDAEIGEIMNLIEFLRKDSARMAEYLQEIDDIQSHDQEVIQAALDLIRFHNILEESISSIQSVLQEWVLSLQELRAGRLSPSLLERNELQRAMNGISETLSRNFPDYRLVYGVNFFYSNGHKFLSYSTHNGTLYVNIRFPVEHTFSKFTLYSIQSYPVLLHAEARDSTVVHMKNKYIAISAVSYTHLTLPTKA